MELYCTAPITHSVFVQMEDGSFFYNIWKTLKSIIKSHTNHIIGRCTACNIIKVSLRIQNADFHFEMFEHSSASDEFHLNTQTLSFKNWNWIFESISLINFNIATLLCNLVSILHLYCKWIWPHLFVEHTYPIPVPHRLFDFDSSYDYPYRYCSIKYTAPSAHNKPISNCSLDNFLHNFCIFYYFLNFRSLYFP